MKRHLLPGIALALATFLLVLPTLDYGYLLEDYKYIRSYSLGEIARTFSSTWEPTQRETRGYRPLHSVHYAFFHRLIGGDPLRNHLLKTGLLIIGALLLYAFGLRCTGSRSTAFWTALTYIFLGGNAWQISWLNHRHHILQLQLILLSLISFDCYLSRRRKLSWFLAFLFFLLAFLLKEEVATFPLVLAAYALLVKGEKIRSLFRPLLPFFLLAIFLVLARAAVLNSLPDDDSFQPAVPTESGSLLREYGRSVFSTLLQTYGVQNPENWEFPMYGSGLTIPRDYLGLLALIGFIILGGALLYHCGTRLQKKAFGFGLLLLLLVSVIVAAWYRNNRLYISSIGVALMAGTLSSCSFRALKAGGRDILKTVIGILSLLFFFIYLAANLASLFEIREALRPDGNLSLLWDSWVHAETLPLMQPEQLRLFRDKLIRSGREEWAEQISLTLNEDATPAPAATP
jgi:hypothetical protein